MAQTNATLLSQAEDLLEDISSNAVQSYSIGDRSVTRAHSAMGQILDSIIKLRGLSSSKRGINVAKIDRAG